MSERNEMRRCVIIGGADIDPARYTAIREYLTRDDFYIFCDSGLKHLARLRAVDPEIVPHLIVGDFDSHENPQMDVETIVLPCEKDDTDTVFAVKEAVRRGFNDFLLIGVVGGRLDHTLGNISILLYLDSIGAKALMVDDFSEMQIISQTTDANAGTALIPANYAYFSLIAVAGPAKGINITGAKYPLLNGTITPEYQYGISNEVLPGYTARVSVDEGRLLLIKVKEES